MGFLSNLFGGQNSSAAATASGGHSINAHTVLAPTSSDVITPTNPGKFDSIRTVPIVPSPRYFDKQEADALRELATEKAEGARQTKRAYKSLGKVEFADAEVHRAHRKYQGKVADAELDKKRGDARLARHLHAMRPEYARLGQGLERAQLGAEKRIAELQAAVRGA